MEWKRKATGGTIAFIGFLLSPLSWWNDAFINLPLAIAFGWILSLVYPPGFELFVIAGYWLSNIVGLFLMQKGAQKAFYESGRNYSARALGRDVLISAAYTLLIVFLLRSGWVKPPGIFPR